MVEESRRPSAQVEPLPTVQRPPPPIDSQIVAAPPQAPSRVLEYSLIGLGAAAVVAGGVFAGLASAANDDFNAAKQQFPADAQRIDSLESDVDRNALLADTLIAGGLVTAGVGVLLFFVRGPSDDGGSLTQVVPVGADG